VLFYRWPALLLWPLSRRGWGLGLIGWNDLVPTLLLYGGCAVALAWPAQVAVAAGAGLVSLALYVAWRWRRSPFSAAWLAWLGGGWARHSPRVCRWLTGDFIT
jgi:hypothetical protein